MRQPAPHPAKPSKSSKARKALTIALPVLLAAALGTLLYATFFHSKAKPTVATPRIAADTFTPPKVTRKARGLDELLAMTPEQLAGVDIAEVNLLCATGLPGAEGLDIDHCLATLDKWAARVRAETDRHLYRLHDPRWAKEYRHSESYLRAVFVLQVLQEDLGVKYDVTAKDNFDFDNSGVGFIHGMIPGPGRIIFDTPGGTCASMPVLYVAVGRRLGYPLKLVTTKGHVFARWDGGEHPNPAWRERFNIEGTNGFWAHPDDYYKSWPMKVTDQEVRANGYLVSLTPMEELAQFLAARGHCGFDNDQPAFAARCYENACRYDPKRPCYRSWFVGAAMRSGYRPATPALARLLEQRMRPAAARRPAVNTGILMPSAAAAAAAAHDLPGGPDAPRVGPSQHPPLTPGTAQPHWPQLPQPGIPRPYQPPAPAQPPGR